MTKTTTIEIMSGYRGIGVVVRFCVLTVILVLAIGAMHSWFGGSWIVDLMLSVLWLLMITVALKNTPDNRSKDRIITTMTPDEIRAVIDR